MPTQPLAHRTPQKEQRPKSDPRPACPNPLSFRKPRPKFIMEASGRSAMEEKIYDVPSEWSHRAYLDEAGYRAKYEASIKDPEAFWAEEARRIHWFKQPTRIKNTN
ncbi:hypothetical protein ILT44_26905, partial [Microvirga sp. BT689]|nr:hypothetical protein [Microvirga arvi]